LKDQQVLLVQLDKEEKGVIQVTLAYKVAPDQLEKLDHQDLLDNQGLLVLLGPQDHKEKMDHPALQAQEDQWDLLDLEGLLGLRAILENQAFQELQAPLDLLGLLDLKALKDLQGLLVPKEIVENLVLLVRPVPQDLVDRLGPEARLVPAVKQEVQDLKVLLDRLVRLDLQGPAVSQELLEYQEPQAQLVVLVREVTGDRLDLKVLLGLLVLQEISDLKDPEGLLGPLGQLVFRGKLEN